MKPNRQLNNSTTRQIRQKLLGWYRKNHRQLPWRAAPGERANPYHVLVSEAMLQQTQVATVIPYFERFIAAMPTVGDLAKAREQKVLKLWQGLGYYRRARNLHAAAKMVVDDFGGTIPADVDDLLKLPGIGRYCAGAIASIAHRQPAPILDGNVARVLSRWFRLTDPADAPEPRKHLWQLAEELVPPASQKSATSTTAPGDFNQAMMELGALICTPKTPSCLLCPMASCCAAHGTPDSERLPIMLPKKKPTRVDHTVIALQRNGKWLFEQRPETGLWSNMWQLPTDENNLKANDIPTWVTERYGLQTNTPTKLKTFKHQTTHRTIHFTVYHAHIQQGRLKSKRGVWRKADDLSDLPLAKPQQKVVELLG